MRALVTLLLLNCLLLVPVWVARGSVGPQWFALEAGCVVGAFLLLPPSRRSRVAAGLTALVFVAVAVLAWGDAAARLSLARPLNLYLDVRLLASVGHLLEGALGVGGGRLALVAAAAGVIVATWAAAALLASLPGTGPRRWRRVGAALLTASLVAIPLRWGHPRGVALGLTGVDLVREQVGRWALMQEEHGLFAAELGAAPTSPRPGPGFLSGLGGRDVILAFIESYGTSVLDDPRYAPVVRPSLEAMEKAFRDRGLHVVSGRLEAPSQGGMSWLGHASVLSGLWLDNQLRYDLLLASERPTLVDDFEAAGYRTVALMPAITLAWPEGERFGYDEIFARRDIAYAGPPLNWVTMPDQFTWSFLESRIRRSGDPRPLFAELGLISSHAPWTPILEVLDDWESIGDGRIFQRWADAGEAPEELWRDTERVREHYARSVRYAVETMASYASRHVDDGTLLIAMGDHQPAPLVTGEGASRAVPVHVVATEPALLEPFLAWGFGPGALPPPGEAPRRMDAFREWFLGAFSAKPTEVTQ